MIILSREELLSCKKSDTIVIYGSGSSINELKDKDHNILSNFDSIGFNWFCFSDIPTTFYVIREQANHKTRRSKEETQKVLYNIMNSNVYSQSVLIVHNMEKHPTYITNYAKKKNLDKFTNSGIVVTDVKLSNNKMGIKIWHKRDIINYGIIHGKCTLNGVLHFCRWMDYKNVIFAGIDLYDSKYFWLKNKTRYTIKRRRKKNTQKHPVHGAVISLIRKTKQYCPDLNMFSYNHKSLLSKVIETWKN